MENSTLKNESKLAKKIKKDLKEMVDKIELQKPRRILLTTTRENLKNVLNYLKDKRNYSHLTAITCEDNLKKFSLIYHLWSNKGIMVSTKITISRNEPEMESITNFFPVANLFEREIYDLFGVKFLGHPDLKRLLLNKNWPDGEYPLRKDWVKDEKKYYGGVRRRCS